MKIYIYYTRFAENRWVDHTLDGIVVANTMTEALGMIIQEHPDINLTRKSFCKDDSNEIDPECLYEFDSTKAGVTIITNDRDEWDG